MGPIHLPMDEQAGVVSRRQVLAAGGDDLMIERRLRRRDWARIHPGVYVGHTGEPNDDQRAWAAVLHAWPAALSGRTALQAHGLRAAGGLADAPAPVEVAIDVRRRVVAPRGVRVRRVTGLDRRVQWHRAPPRLRVEDAALMVASESPPDEAMALLADACQQRLTTADRLVVALDAWPRLPGRVGLLRVLADVRTGAWSVLEQRYLRDVERAHGLPTGRRQAAFERERRHGYRDVLYEETGVVVELDGRLGHTAAVDRARDLDRDLLATAQGLVTVRLGWSQVLAPCRLAEQLADLMTVRGWAGSARACSPECAVAGSWKIVGT